jgi:hypothetical protein
MALYLALLWRTDGESVVPLGRGDARRPLSRRHSRSTAVAGLKELVLTGRGFSGDRDRVVSLAMTLESVLGGTNRDC